MSETPPLRCGFCRQPIRPGDAHGVLIETEDDRGQHARLECHVRRPRLGRLTRITSATFEEPAP